MIRMQARFIEQEKEGVLKSRAVEDRLINETWASRNDYELHPKLKSLNIPVLVIIGDHDFFPFAAEHIAQANPGARLVTLRKAIAERLQNCGLELHPEKTKIVYCKDDDRRRTYLNEKFDFLGYTFRARSSMTRKGRIKIANQ